MSVVRDSDSAGDGGEIDDTPFDRVVLHGTAEGAVVAVGVVVEIVVEEVSDKVVGEVVGEESSGKVDEDVEERLEFIGYLHGPGEVRQQVDGHELVGAL